MENDFANIRLDRCKCDDVDKKMVSVGTQVNPMDIGGMRWQNWFIYLWGRDVTEREEEMGHVNVKVLKAKMMVQGYMRAKDRIEERTGSFVSLK